MKYSHAVLILLGVFSCKKHSEQTKDSFSFNGAKIYYPLDSIKTIFSSGGPSDDARIVYDSVNNNINFRKDTMKDFDGERDLEDKKYFSAMVDHSAGPIIVNLKNNKMISLDAYYSRSSIEIYRGLINKYEGLYGQTSEKNDSLAHWSGDDSELTISFNRTMDNSIHYELWAKE